VDLRLVYLYGDLMNLYGDRGNILALQQRCAWRGIRLQVENVTIGDRFDPAATQLLFFGGGQDAEQAAISRDLAVRTGEAVEEAIQDGAALLAVCGGYQLLGRSFRTAEGVEIPGTGLFDAYTIAGSRRCVGDVVAEATLDGDRFPLVGFENHSGKTYLMPGGSTAPATDQAGPRRTVPLARVIVGSGNNGEDATEGARYLGAIGTYLHGPILPKNPWLADWLILTGLRRLIGPEATLAPLDDQLESAARDAFTERARRRRHTRTSIR